MSDVTPGWNLGRTNGVSQRKGTSLCRDHLQSRWRACIVLAVSPKAFEQAYQSLRRGGTLPADNTVQLPIFETVLNGIKIIGSIVGTRVDLAEVFQLHAAGRTRVMYETRKLEQVNEAFEDVEQPAWRLESFCRCK